MPTPSLISPAKLSASGSGVTVTLTAPFLPLKVMPVMVAVPSDTPTIAPVALSTLTTPGLLLTKVTALADILRQLIAHLAALAHAECRLVHAQRNFAGGFGNR